MEYAQQRLPANPPAMPEFLNREIRRCPRRARLQVGQTFLCTGDDVDVFAVVVTGSLRVFTAGGTGREITLYSVGPGESCMINALCLIAGASSPVTAIAEEPVEAVLFPRRVFVDWLAERPDVRAFVFGDVAARVGSMMALIEEIAFQRLDCRLAGYLYQRSARAAADDEIATTHDAIAGDLGTAREVVSRLLKSFERQGAIALGRGAIRVRNPEFLRELAQGAGP
ncbi:MAG TPA: Crp/Fnr family transcriptional regulator [Candidatus Krumholzibacteria bacterium]|nr:Crp/Fnr family transcriptional regulator [Candidatus Krumholzibacteria bacterium]HPD70411.1 Crp/Fnr family transcriptional regulator [Candidatus Krumholzibacteria bacterium]HRY39889.1 Crp/Fnr family transcriptional regulator [Candidatus Krumholzibacteria bacterium]